MPIDAKKYFGTPDLDFSKLAEPISEEEAAYAYEKIMNQPKTDWRAFVDDIEAHPEHLTSWDMSISFEEFARRVRAGEYD